MKDFYKILGVKESASEEEIRERWIELTKHYHPDRGEDIAFDEKIREINEAYQVLKHSSTRVEYDLQRTYGNNKRESYFKKLSVPASILILVIILGVIYIKNDQPPPPSEPVVSNKRNQTNQRNEINQINQTNQIDSSTQQTQPRINGPTQQPQVATSTPAIPIINPKNARETINAMDSTTQRPKDMISPITPSNAMATKMEKIQLHQPSQTLITQLSNDSIANSPRDAMIPIKPIDPKIELAQFKPPSLLATEDEVKKFFNEYIDRYDRMDIEGFLSFFSPKAIQNQKDRLEGIRKIYTDFFNQGETVRYRIQDMKIEIYQNAVEVRARYEIVQILKTGGGGLVWRGNVQWVLGKENGALKILSLDYQHQ